MKLDSRGLVTNAEKSSQTIQVSGITVSGVSVYNVAGNNYFKLRDLQAYLGFGLRYDESTRTVVITTKDAPTPVGAMTLSAARDYDAIRSGLDTARSSANAGRAGGGGMWVEEARKPTMPMEDGRRGPEAPAAMEECEQRRRGGGLLRHQRPDRGRGRGRRGEDRREDPLHPPGAQAHPGPGRREGHQGPLLRHRGGERRGHDGWMSTDPFGLYISGDRVAVLSGRYESGVNAKGYWDYRQYTAVDLYDVSDPARPKAVTTLGQDGWHMGARLKDGTLYLVTNYAVWNYDEQDPHTYVPALYRNGQAEVLPAGDVWLCPEVSSTRYVVVTAYDLKTGEDCGSPDRPGGGDTLYMSHDNIYVADSYFKETSGAPRTEGVYTVTEYRNEMVTDLIRFDLSDGLEVAASGRVPGQLENQFSLDEYQGYLRLATTTSHYSYTLYNDEKMGFTNYKWDEDEDQTNGLYILDSDLAVVGSVTSLAPGERIYSVRFDGDIAYFCTFRNLDPLFAVNVSDPASPKVLSALKISGFSQYLHPWADGLLFGAGYEADEDTGRRETLKLVMFDTADKADVTAKSTLVTELDYSEALDNHHAFLISREKNLIAFPADDQYVIYGYDPAKGFYPQAALDLEGWSWNTRGLYVNDMLYVVGDEAITVITLEGLDLVKTVKLPVE